MRNSVNNSDNNFQYLLSETPLEKKIGQLLIFGFNNREINEDDAITNDLIFGRVGGVILFDFNIQTQKKGDKNIKNPEQLKNLIKSIYNYASLNKNFPLPIVSVDYEGGFVNRLKSEYGFEDLTIPAKEIAKKSIDERKLIFHKMNLLLKKYGFNLNFAPILDLDINQDNPIIGKLKRSFSFDPNVVFQCAQEFVQISQSQRIACVAKHFPGHGSSNDDTHLDFVDVTDTWRESELLPYQQLINSKYSPKAIMSAHVINRKMDKEGLPATLSSPTLKYLRENLKFEGIIISDDLEMGALSKHYSKKETVIKALNAGIDVLLYCGQLGNTTPREIISIIIDAVNSGEVPLERINQAFLRVCQLKTFLSKANI